MNSRINNKQKKKQKKTKNQDSNNFRASSFEYQKIMLLIFRN